MFSMSRTYNYLGSTIYNHIAAGSTYNLGGMGSINIGSIGENAVLYISGMGSVHINGQVGENVRFIFSREGSLTFAQRPPESVIRNISHTGIGSIRMPGGYVQQSQAVSSSRASF